jgi:flavin reductase (DIM6/NTAB) family NADH-FMN oxidoreductase RutF
MHYEVSAGHGLPHDPFKALVAPRPIGWISSLDKQGRVNLAPYSFFNAISDKPHMVAFSSAGTKDSLQNILETGEFVCSMATYDLRDAMNATSATLPHGTSEFDHAGLEAAPSFRVKPPRVKAAPAALECKLLQTVPLVSLEGEQSYTLVIGQVVAIYIDDAMIKNGLVDTAALDLIARGGYHDYFRASAANRFSITRPK